MSVITTRAELTAACEQLPAVHPTVQSASEMLDVLTATFDGSTNPDSLAAISVLRQAIESLNKSGTAYTSASQLLTGYGASM